MFGEELYVEWTGDVQLLSYRGGYLAYLADRGDVQCLWRQHEGCIAAVYAGVFDVLADRPQYELPVFRDRINFHFACMGFEF